MSRETSDSEPFDAVHEQALRAMGAVALQLGDCKLAGALLQRAVAIQAALPAPGRPAPGRRSGSSSGPTATPWDRAGRDTRALRLLVHSHMRERHYAAAAQLLVDAIAGTAHPAPPPKSAPDSPPGVSGATGPTGPAGPAGGAASVLAARTAAAARSDPQVWKLIALTYYKLGRYDDAQHAITQAFELLPPNPSPEESLVYLQCKVFTLAEPQQVDHNGVKYENSTKRPSSPQPSVLDQILPVLQRFLESKQISQNLPLFSEILMARAQILRNFGNLPMGASDLYHLTQIINDPNLIQQFPPRDRLIKGTHVYMTLAVLKYYTNEYDTSQELINDWLIKARHTLDTQVELKILSNQLRYLANRDLEIAVDELMWSLQIAPLSKHDMINYMIARLLLQINPNDNIPVAYDFYQRALNLTPHKPYIWISIASLYLRLGQLNDALSTYSQAIPFAASNNFPEADIPYTNYFNNIFAGVAWYGISQVYVASMQINSALEALNHALQIFKAENHHQYVSELETLRKELVLFISKQNPTNDNSQFDSSQSIAYTLPDLQIQLLVDYKIYEINHYLDYEKFLDEDLAAINPVEIDKISESSVSSSSQKANGTNSPRKSLSGQTRIRYLNFDLQSSLPSSKPENTNGSLSDSSRASSMILPSQSTANKPKSMSPNSSNMKSRPKESPVSTNVNGNHNYSNTPQRANITPTVKNHGFDTYQMVTKNMHQQQNIAGSHSSFVGGPLNNNQQPIASYPPPMSHPQSISYQRNQGMPMFVQGNAVLPQTPYSVHTLAMENQQGGQQATQMAKSAHFTNADGTPENQVSYTFSQFVPPEGREPIYNNGVMSQYPPNYGPMQPMPMQGLPSNGQYQTVYYGRPPAI